MKKYLFLAVAATVFAACSSDSDPVSQAPENGKNNTEVANVPVTFGAYVNRATTRAGQTGELTTSNLPTPGFGVFAYYTDNADYSVYATPNFMYNQHVTGTVPAAGGAATWTYSPVKYWPNEFGNTAESDDIDKVSFFAYAPWVDVTPGNGNLTAAPAGVDADNWKNSNIIQLSRNTATGDPLVKYMVDPDPATSVDLLWGVQPATATYVPSVGTFTSSAGKPYIDLVKGTTASTIQFDFKHALAKLNVQIDAVVDQANPTSTALNANQTRIYVRSITFTGFETRGALNLNNTDADIPMWLNFDGNKDIAGNGCEVTIYDGMKDGKEARSGSTQRSEKPAALNPVLVQNDCYQNGAFKTTATTGVTENAVNLFNSTTKTDPIYVIPTDESMDVTIVYDVETIDPNLPTTLADGFTNGSSIENKITKTAVFGTTGATAVKIEAGKAYTLKLHLGMNSVTFDASVTGWDGTTTNTTDTNLPANN